MKKFSLTSGRSKRYVVKGIDKKKKNIVMGNNNNNEWNCSSVVWYWLPLPLVR
jgi:hypothetical protein